MQYLNIKESTTLSSVAKMVGQRNVDSVLAANDLKRMPNVGSQFVAKCKQIASTAKAATSQQKSAILNAMTYDAEVFETAALLSSSGWKVLSTLGAFPNAIAIPESISLPNSANVIGGSGVPISTSVYKKVMDCLKDDREIDGSVFSNYSTMRPVVSSSTSRANNSTNTFNCFKIPWGAVTLYSSLANESIQFPVYPEELEDGYNGNYTTMPDTIYQYEPWYTYENSNRNDVELTFHFHRDMWSGDHRDGKANQLIRFCQACCYPRYAGSAVTTSTVTLYINGSIFVSGIMRSASPKWGGPIGLDGWYLDCELSIAISEVAPKPRNFDQVRSMNIIGD